MSENSNKWTIPISAALIGAAGAIVAAVIAKPGSTRALEPDPNAELIQKCPAVRDMSELSWESGHKHDFCTGLGFTSVITTGKYGSGNFCYEGDKDACLGRIRKGI